MAMKITDECVCCATCREVCPTGAIYENEEDEKYDINPDICVECEGFNPIPACADICSVGCIVKAD